MKHLLAGAIIICSALTANLACAADPLWAKAVGHYKSLGKWVAADIETETYLEVNGEKKKVLVKSRLTSWSEGKPVYSVVSREPPLELGKVAKKGNSVDALTNQLGEILTVDAHVKRFDNLTLGGKAVTLFHVEESHVGAKLSFKVWVDPTTGIPQESETKTRIPMMMEMRMLTLYTELANVGLVEKQSDANFESLVPFQNKKGRTIIRPTNWMARPN